MSQLLRAGIIGLGQIGSRFDEDPKRTSVWTHAGAYTRVPEVVLVAGADPDEAARGAFERRWGVSRAYADYRRMLEAERLDIVSVCVPTPLHAEVVVVVVEASVRAVFCEKPIAATVEESRMIVEQYRKRGIVLAVNYMRRWDRNYLWARDLVRQGCLGKLLRVSGIYSGQVFNIGTHLIDVMQMCAGEVEWVVGERGGDPTDSDPPVSGLLRFKNDVLGSLLSLPTRTDLVFELDLLGTEGRVRVLENGRRIETFRFTDSLHYSGYREMGPADLSNPLPDTDRFVEAIRDIVRCISQGGQPACSGQDGLAALETATALCQSARAGGRKQPVFPGGNRMSALAGAT